MELLMIRKERIFLYEGMRKTTLLSYLSNNHMEMHAANEETFKTFPSRKKFCKEYQDFLDREKPVFPGIAGVSYLVKYHDLTNEDVFKTMGISVFWAGRTEDNTQIVFIPAYTFEDNKFSGENCGSCDIYCFPELLARLTLTLMPVPSVQGLYQLPPASPLMMPGGEVLFGTPQPIWPDCNGVLEVPEDKEPEPENEEPEQEETLGASEELEEALVKDEKCQSLIKKKAQLEARQPWQPQTEEAFPLDIGMQRFAIMRKILQNIDHNVARLEHYLVAFEASVMLCNIVVLIKLLVEGCLSWDK